jgi:hypothetical protein
VPAAKTSPPAGIAVGAGGCGVANISPESGAVPESGRISGWNPPAPGLVLPADAPAPAAPLDPLVPPVLAELSKRDGLLEELQAPAIAAAHSQTPPTNRSQKPGDALMGFPFAKQQSYAARLHFDPRPAKDRDRNAPVRSKRAKQTGFPCESAWLVNFNFATAHVMDVTYLGRVSPAARQCESVDPPGYGASPCDGSTMCPRKSHVAVGLS